MNTGLTDPTAVMVTLAVPNLADRPFVGGGCCFLPASQVVGDEIRAWPGVNTVTVDETGSVMIILDSAAVDLTPILDSLASLGYPAEVQSHRAQKRR